MTYNLSHLSLILFLLHRTQNSLPFSWSLWTCDACPSLQQHRQQQLRNFCWCYRSWPDLQCFSWPCLTWGTTGDRKVIMLKQVPPSLLSWSLPVMLSDGRCTFCHTTIANWLWRSHKKTLKKSDVSCGTAHLNPIKSCIEKWMCNYLQTHLYLHKQQLAKVLQWISADVGSFLAIFLFFCPKNSIFANHVNKSDTEFKNFCLLKIQSRRISARNYPFFFSHVYRWEVEALGRSRAFLPGGYP